MYTTYHFKSAAEIDINIIDAIKASFKSKAVVITVEEEIDETSYLMSNPVNKAMLLESIAQDKRGESVTVHIPIT
jgi:PHD/YefM family antitoxin component YafN of YafNO toxin-antitoxin module